MDIDRYTDADTKCHGNIDGNYNADCDNDSDPNSYVDRNGYAHTV